MSRLTDFINLRKDKRNLSMASYVGSLRSTPIHAFLFNQGPYGLALFRLHSDDEFRNAWFRRPEILVFLVLAVVKILLYPFAIEGFGLHGDDLSHLA